MVREQPLVETARLVEVPGLGAQLGEHLERFRAVRIALEGAMTRGGGQRFPARFLGVVVLAGVRARQRRVDLRGVGPTLDDLLQHSDRGIDRGLVVGPLQIAERLRQPFLMGGVGDALPRHRRRHRATRIENVAQRRDEPVFELERLADRPRDRLAGDLHAVADLDQRERRANLVGGAAHGA